MFAGSHEVETVPYESETRVRVGFSNGYVCEFVITRVTWVKLLLGFDITRTPLQNAPE